MKNSTALEKKIEFLSKDFHLSRKLSKIITFRHCKVLVLVKTNFWAQQKGGCNISRFSKVHFESNSHMKGFARLIAIAVFEPKICLSKVHFSQEHTCHSKDQEICKKGPLDLGVTQIQKIEVF